MILSILIPSIPSRFNKAQELYSHLTALCEWLDVEILMLTDNKKRTIGEKREALKNISTGDYFMFVDDDDSLFSVKEIYDACKYVDVVTFKSRSRNADGSTFIVTFGLGNEVEHNTEDGRYLDCKRPPFTQCAWSARFRGISFPSISYGEDWEWVKKAIAFAKTETHIDEVLHGYNFDPAASEADTATNKHWINPNMEEAKPCVVNLATGQFIKGQKRLMSTLVGYPVLTFISEAQVGAPSHQENPYAFKIYAIEEARRQGYNQILWLDASVYPVKDITPVFNWITEKGIFLEEAGHYAGSWSPDHVLGYFGVTRQESMAMPMFSAGYCGFDFRNPISQEFFAEWKESMLNGMFKGSWSDHRHDMTCGSIIANKIGLLPIYSKGGTFFAYVGESFGTPKETVVCLLQGM
jgi:hypothetical protein